MKKRLYILIIITLTIMIAGTAFIPQNNNNQLGKENGNVDLVNIHPEAGYIEEIGN